MQIPVVMGGAKQLDPAALEKYHDGIGFLDTVIGDRAYAAGQHLTIADLALVASISRVVNIGSGIGTDSIADSDTQYRISIGGTFKKRVPEGYRGGIDRYSDTDTSSVIIVCHYSLSYNKK
jgi:hypothetical protein